MVSTLNSWDFHGKIAVSHLGSPDPQ